MVRRLGGRDLPGGRARCVPGLDGAAQVGPGVAARAGTWGFRSALALEMGSERLGTGDGEAVVRLPHRRQGGGEVSPAAPGLESRAGVVVASAPSRKSLALGRLQIVAWLCPRSPRYRQYRGSLRPCRARFSLARSSRNLRNGALEPHRDAVGELEALRLSAGAIHADRAHRGIHKECEGRDVPGGCRGVERVSGNCK